MNKELWSRQICLIIIAFIPINKLFAMPSILAKNASEDMWICCLISLVVDFLCLLAVIYTMKKTHLDFYSLLQNCLGKVGAKIILFSYFIFFLLKAVIPINEQKEYIDLTLYTLKPSVFYFLPFFISAFFLCIKRLRILGRASDVCWALTLVGFVILLSLSLGNADFNALLPIGAQGAKNIFSGWYKTLNWFGDCAYFVFFIGEFQFNKKDGIKIALSYLLCAVIVMTFIIVFYCIFTSIAYRQRFAFTEISKYTTVINNLGRFDYIGIIFLMFSNFFTLSLPLFFACHILNKIFNIKRPYISALIVICIQIIPILFFSRFYSGIEYFAQNYAGIIFLIFGNVIPVLTPLLTLRRKVYANSKS